MLGGIVEFAHGASRSSVRLRAVLKKSTFETADDRSGQYFGINFTAGSLRGSRSITMRRIDRERTSARARAAAAAARMPSMTAERRLSDRRP